MRMTIADMVYAFKVQAERIDSAAARNFATPKIILALNVAMITLVKAKYSPSNENSGFESTQVRKRELQNLIVFDQEIKDPIETREGYAFDLKKLPHEVLFITRVRFLGDKDGCVNQIIDGNDIQSDDLNVLNRSANTEPSFEWRETNYRQADNKIIADTDGTFKLTSCLIEYIRYPKPVDIAGYNKADGSISTTEECELPAMIHPELVSLSVRMFDLWRRNPEAEFSTVAEQLASSYR